MRKRDLAPDYENLYSTFCEDSIGRNEDLLYFIKLLDSISGPYSIAVDGHWGSGKTFFGIKIWGSGIFWFTYA